LLKLAQDEISHRKKRSAPDWNRENETGHQDCDIRAMPELLSYFEQRRLAGLEREEGHKKSRSKAACVIESG
jgi:hypothetical protein